MNLPEEEMEWPENREPVTDQSLVRELRRKAGPFHPLFLRKVTVLAKRMDCDDVLFFVHRKQKPFPWYI